MPAPWPQTPAELAAAHCSFGVDRVSGRDDVTDFKRRARWQQAWWREANQLPCGSHVPPRASDPTPNGSRLEVAHAKAEGSNFLSDRIRDAVRARLAAPQPHQTLDEARLWSDLLSSMPLCFNLFGELYGRPDRLRGAVDTLWPEHPGKPETIEFEWSPGRRDPVYLNNRSAFDAALLMDLGDGTGGVIGIETKYHEDIKRERPPDEAKRMPRYREVTERSGLFSASWEHHIMGTHLQQFWLDHLLVLSMLQHPDKLWGWGQFLIVYPSANPSVKDAARRYGELLTSHETFEVRTIEELLDADVLHEPATAAEFRERYLW